MTSATSVVRVEPVARKGTKAWQGMVHVDRKKEHKRDPERERQFDEYWDKYIQETAQEDKETDDNDS